MTNEILRSQSGASLQFQPGLIEGAGLGGGGGRQKVPAACNSKTINCIEIKFGGVMDNHKLINVV